MMYILCPEYMRLRHLESAVLTFGFFHIRTLHYDDAHDCFSTFSDRGSPKTPLDEDVPIDCRFQRVSDDRCWWIHSTPTKAAYSNLSRSLHQCFDCSTFLHSFRGTKYHKSIRWTVSHRIWAVEYELWKWYQLSMQAVVYRLWPVRDRTESEIIPSSMHD